MPNLEKDSCQKLSNIFFPYANDRIKSLKDKNLVHYTTATTAMQIIKNESDKNNKQMKELWMRNAYAMNDFSEIQYGIDLIRKTLSDYTGTNLQNVLSDCEFENNEPIFDKVKEQLFNENTGEWISHKFNTYITCLTEHDETENEIGRLSMWRAYGGGNNGVAIVFRKGYIFEDYEKDNISLSPVAYFSNDGEKIQKEFERVINNINDNKDFLKTIKTNIICNLILNALRAAMVSIKHIGFSEEKEWRLVAHKDDLIKNYTPSIEAPRGIVQPVFKIPFNITNIERIIIGPTQYYSVMYKAFVHLLKINNIDTPEKRVIISQIPYREI